MMFKVPNHRSNSNRKNVFTGRFCQVRNAHDEQNQCCEFSECHRGYECLALNPVSICYPGPVVGVAKEEILDNDQ